jgi:hypothetical protein
MKIRFTKGKWAVDKFISTRILCNGEMLDNRIYGSWCCYFSSIHGYVLAYFEMDGIWLS